MKKNIIVVLLLTILVINPCSAIENQFVHLNILNVPLKSKLSEKYSAYQIEFINVGQNPIQISEVRCLNKINIADTSSIANINIKKTAICSVLALPTLGLSLLFLIPDQAKLTKDMYSSLNDVSRYTPINSSAYSFQNGSVIKTNNEIFTTGQRVKYDVLVPLNENPEIEASFKDLKTSNVVSISN